MLTTHLISSCSDVIQPTKAVTLVSVIIWQESGSSDHQRKQKDHRACLHPAIREHLPKHALPCSPPYFGAFRSSKRPRSLPRNPSAAIPDTVVHQEVKNECQYQQLPYQPKTSETQSISSLQAAGSSQKGHSEMLRQASPSSPQAAQPGPPSTHPLPPRCRSAPPDPFHALLRVAGSFPLASSRRRRPPWC